MSEFGWSSSAISACNFWTTAYSHSIGLTGAVVAACWASTCLARQLCLWESLKDFVCTTWLKLWHCDWSVINCWQVQQNSPSSASSTAFASSMGWTSFTGSNNCSTALFVYLSTYAFRFGCWFSLFNWRCFHELGAQHKQNIFRCIRFSTMLTRAGPSSTTTTLSVCKYDSCVCACALQVSL